MSILTTKYTTKIVRTQWELCLRSGTTASAIVEACGKLPLSTRIVDINTDDDEHVTIITFERETSEAEA